MHPPFRDPVVVVAVVGKHPAAFQSQDAVGGKSYNTRFRFQYCSHRGDPSTPSRSNSGTATTTPTTTTSTTTTTTIIMGGANPRRRGFLPTPLPRFPRTPCRQGCRERHERDKGRTTQLPPGTNEPLARLPPPMAATAAATATILLPTKILTPQQYQHHNHHHNHHTRTTMIFVPRGGSANCSERRRPIGRWIPITPIGTSSSKNIPRTSSRIAFVQ